MITVNTMESSGDYNNHNITIKENGKVMFDKCLLGFNNTTLYSKLSKLTTNERTVSIPELDVYGYEGELPDLSIISELIEYSNSNKAN